MMIMREAMLKAGLITEDYIRKVEATERRKQEELRRSAIAKMQRHIDLKYAVSAFPYRLQGEIRNAVDKVISVGELMILSHRVLEEGKGKPIREQKLIGYRLWSMWLSGDVRNLEWWKTLN